MIDQLVTEAAKPILGVAVVGPLCVLLILVVIVRERYWQKREAEREKRADAQEKELRDALTEANKALLAEAKSNLTALHLFQDQAKSQEAAFEAFTSALGRRDK